MGTTDKDRVLVLAEADVARESLLDCASQCSDCDCPDGDCCTDY